MGQRNLKKITAPAAASLTQDIDLSAEARALLTPESTPAEFIDQLIDKEYYGDAVNFMARALPKREATWWACLCAHHALDASPVPEHKSALEAAERWVYKPSEDHRRQAMTAAEATQFDHPASWAAVAAFWSGGSLAPENAPVVPPADNLNAKAVTGAVRLAAVMGDPVEAVEKYRLFLEQALDIAAGGDGRKVTASAAGA